MRDSSETIETHLIHDLIYDSWTSYSCLRKNILESSETREMFSPCHQDMSPRHSNYQYVRVFTKTNIKNSRDINEPTNPVSLEIEHLLEWIFEPFNCIRDGLFE